MLADAIIAPGDGQMILTMRVAPGVEVQPGDEGRLTIAHPAVFDFTTATRSTALVGARCLGWEVDLFSGIQRLTLLIGGASPGMGYLCPSLVIASKSSSTVVVIAASDAQWLRGDDKVLIYNPGEEQAATPEITEMTITADGVGATTVEFTGTLPSWVGTDSIITYAENANCTTRQQRFTHCVTTDTWS